MTITHPEPGAIKKGGQCGCGCADAHPCVPLKALQRNTFFPNKLMEVRHWQGEQDYHRDARHLVTRLGLGSGVLCGLEVHATETGTVVITEGVGADGRGRLVVVPEDVEVDPAQPTDSCGHPSGDKLTEGTVTVWLCHHECGTDPVRMPPEGCGTEAVCVPAMVREAYAVIVTPEPTDRAGLPDGLCQTLFHRDGDEDRRARLDRLDPRGCDCAEICIPLATVALDDPRRVDTRVRTVIRSNRELLDLLLCLAERVDECCGEAATARPPRITGWWPWPGAKGTGWTDLIESRRLEMAFDRVLADQGLDNPEDWLGVWLLDPDGATRLVVKRDGDPLTHVTVPLQGGGAAYRARYPDVALHDDAAVVVMIKAGTLGPIQAKASDQLALDPDLAATGLSDDDRAELWRLAPGDTNAGLAALAEAATKNAPPAALPTGDGVAGGDLHVVYSPPADDPAPPRLMEVWPPGAAIYGTGQAIDDYRLFLERPRLNLKVSRALADDALNTPKDWLRAWCGAQDDDSIYGIESIDLACTAADPVLPDGTMRYVFDLVGHRPQARRSVYLVQLRATPPLVPGAPLGKDDPTTLLDADFDGTRFDPQMLVNLWNGALPDPLPLPPVARPTTGEQLFDGLAGGVADWTFTVELPR